MTWDASLPNLLVVCVSERQFFWNQPPLDLSGVVRLHRCVCVRFRRFSQVCLFEWWVSTLCDISAVHDSAHVRHTYACFVSPCLVLSCLQLQLPGLL